MRWPVARGIARAYWGNRYLAQAAVAHRSDMKLTPTTENLRRPGFVMAALLAIPILFSTPTLAQVGTFGSQVSVGDPDYIPLTKKDAVAITVNEVDLGQPTIVHDNCISLDAASAPGVQFKDIRLTPCQGFAAGTFIADTDVQEKSAPSTKPAVQVFTADVNNNGKYDKGDHVYVSTSVAATGFTASTATGTWTVRLTNVPCVPAAPKPCYTAGSFVQSSDPDMISWGGNAKVSAFSLAEREDKGWYIMPGVAPRCGTLDRTVAANWVTAPSINVKVCDEASASIVKNGLVPANSIRVAVPGLTALQPNVQPTGITIPNAQAWRAGQSVDVLVPIANGGTQTGAGLLVTRLGTSLMDARLSPVLGPGEKANLLVTFTIPTTASGTHELAVNDIFQVVSVAPGASPQNLAGDAGAVGADSQIVALQARVAALEATAPPVAATRDAALARAPGFEMALGMAAVMFGLLAMRRRGSGTL